MQLKTFTSIAQKKALSSEEMAHRKRWRRFVNWEAGKGKNIECETAQEICNRTCKSVALDMGANKTSMPLYERRNQLLELSKLSQNLMLKLNYTKNPQLIPQDLLKMMRT